MFLVNIIKRKIHRECESDKLMNKIYEKKPDHVIALWCPAFSSHGMPKTQQPIIMVIILIIYLFLLFKDLVKILKIYFRQNSY